MPSENPRFPGSVLSPAPVGAPTATAHAVGRTIDRLPDLVPPPPDVEWDGRQQFIANQMLEEQAAWEATRDFQWEAAW